MNTSSQSSKGLGPTRLRGVAALQIGFGLLVFSSARATPITPPDPTVCDGVTCQDVAQSSCSAAGFKISLKNYVPGSTQNSGTATYVYEVCSPAPGVCSGALRPGETCLDDDFCRRKGQQTDPAATCSRECSSDTFRGLSHFDVTFPALAADTCLAPGTEITGSCAGIDRNGDGVPPTVGGFVLGDSSCFSGDASGNVAKCDGTSIDPGDCIEMTLSIAGETTELGFGATVVVDKEATTCTSSCLAGPSCERCDDPPSSNHCLTRTLGFWGTHPWITNDFATVAQPIGVCGRSLDCAGADDGKSNPACMAGSCDSVMEGLGSNPGGELPTNQPYVSFVKQLTAAKLNLAATAALAPPGTRICGDWTYGGKTIREWLATCEGTATASGLVGGLCSSNKAQISGSGCIEALDAFNNSEDSGFEQTPPPFARPSADDHGAVSGADPSQFDLAKGKTTPPGKLVIGKFPGGGTSCQ